MLQSEMNENTILRLLTLPLAIVFLLVSQAMASDILINGDFEAGNTGFGSDYTHRDCAWSEGTYDVLANPSCHPSGFSFQDHTSEKGLMLVANGSGDSKLTIWKTAVTVSTNKVYAFSGWAASWGGHPTFVDSNAPAMRIFINGTQQGGSVQTPHQAGIWQNFTALWNSESSKSAVIEVRLQTTSAIGNDIALDDLSFNPLTASEFASFTTRTINEPTSPKTITTNQAPTVSIYRAVEIEWQSVSNRLYQLQWSSSLPSETWFNLGPPTLASSTNSSAFDRVLLEEKKFYRILSLE